MKPMCIDLFCGLGGWTDGFLAEGYECIGFDLERHNYGQGGYPSQLVLQDILTLHGSQFRDATCIVASPPCQKYSYMAMPWSRAKQIAGALRGEVDFPEEYTGPRNVTELNALFKSCFRIQHEASESAERIIPLVVENVKGAQSWVGTAKAHYGSFYLWGDVGSVAGAIIGTRPRFGETLRAKRAIKNGGGSWFGIGSPGQVETGQNPVSGTKGEGQNWSRYAETGEVSPHWNVESANGLKLPGNNSEYLWADRRVARLMDAPMPGDAFYLASSGGSKRKAASAQIAKIPEPLARHIARIYHP